MVEHVLFPNQVKHLIQSNLWPTEFVEEGQRIAFSKEKEKENENGEEEDEEEDEFFVNPNHRNIPDWEESSSEEDS